MKASKLIKLLQAEVAREGDCDVKVSIDMSVANIYEEIVEDMEVMVGYGEDSDCNKFIVIVNY